MCAFERSEKGMEFIMKKIFSIVMIILIFMTTSSVISKDGLEANRLPKLDTKVIDARANFYNQLLEHFSNDTMDDETSEEVSNYSNIEYPYEDEYLLAQLMFCEAGGCDKSEMARCGQVVLNRVTSNLPDFANCNSIRDVITQKGQYPQTWAKIVRGIKPSDEALEVSHGLLEGTLDSGLSEDVLWQTGFIPRFNAHVVYQSPWHYYSVYGR